MGDADTLADARGGVAEPAKDLSPRDLRSWAEIAVSVALVVVSGRYLVEAIRASSSLSLANDELVSVFDYAQRGPVHTLTTYDVANNHVLFNLLNSLTPGAASVDPARARFWSYVCAVALPTLGGLELARRRWYLAGALFFAVFAASPTWLDLALQARGYGLLAFAVLVASIGAWRYLEEPRRRWLAVIGGASLVGCWALPSFAFFVAPLWVLIFLLRRRRSVVVAAALAGAATFVAYLGVAGQVLDQFSRYRDEWGVQFRGRDVFGSIHLYLLARTYLWPLTVAWGFGALGAVLVLIGRPPIVARSLTWTVRVLVVVGVLFFAVCVLMKTSPVRTTAFVSVPLGLVVVASVGAIAAQRANGLLHLGATSLLFVSAVLGGYAVQDQATPDTWPPVENWMGAAQYIGATFPTGTTVYVAPDEPPRFLRGYIDDGYPVIGGFDPFDPAAFAAGRLVVVHFATGSEEDFDPGSPFVETDLLQQRGMRPAHVMRILFAPFLVVDRLMCRSPMSRLLSFTTAICPRP